MKNYKAPVLEVVEVELTSILLTSLEEGDNELPIMPLNENTPGTSPAAE